MLRRLNLATEWDELTILGGSRAGEGTLLLLPQLSLALDIGRAHRSLTPMSTVCISHGHADHLGGLAYWASQRLLNSMAPGTLLVPGNIGDEVADLLRLHARLEGGKAYAVNLVPVGHGTRHHFRRDMNLEFFTTDHWVPTLGSRLVWTRRRLLPELRNSPSEDLAARRRRGQEITYEVASPLLAYGADTGPGIFAQAETLAAEVVLLECSFWNDDDLDRARRFSHLHLSDIVNAAPQLTCRHLVLLHLSRRNRIKDVEKIMAAELEPLFDGRLHHLIVDWE
ncbi:MAG: MBL fold metallo-hydrolase [Thermoanaerobaculales bacterium]|nr:MBL fold metallo-hydrolase [Thermoanaerobaculales bacterium]